MTRPMPWMLKGFMLVSLVFGVFVGLACLAFLVAAAASGGPYLVQGAVVSRDEFLAFAVPVLLTQSALCALSCAAAWGLFRRRYWARPLLLGLAVAGVVFSLLAGALAGLPWSQILGVTLVGVPGLIAFWWVLYRRDDIVDWFEELREAE